MMNTFKNGMAALRGLIPHVSDKRIRRLQAAYVCELTRCEPDTRDSQRLNDAEWAYIENVIKQERVS